MARLSTEEKTDYSASQNAELDRMSDRRQSDFLEPPDTRAEDVDAVRTKVKDSWQKQSAPQLKVRTNIDGFGNVLAYAPENNYTRAEQDSLSYGWRANAGKKANVEIPAILTQDAEMVTDGIGVDIRKAILKARGA